MLRSSPVRRSPAPVPCRGAAWPLLAQCIAPAICLSLPVRGAAEDCDRNGLDDTCEAPEPVQFAEPETTRIGRQPLLQLAPADLDGDADLDLVVVSAPDSVLGVLRQQERRFTDLGPLAGLSRAVAVAILDADEDGDVDLALATGAARVDLLLNDGQAAWQRGQQLLLTLPAVAIEAADVTRDGRADLAALGTLPNNLLADQVSVFASLGGGRFALGRNFAVDLGPVAIAAADLSGDGASDLAVTTGSGTVLVLENVPAPGFFETRRVLADLGQARGLAAADFDGDGLPDLALSLGTRVRLYRSEGGLQFPVGRDILASRGGVESLTAGDANGDGAIDLCAGDDRTAAVLENDGRGLFARSVRLAFDARLEPTGPILCSVHDLDGDGATDLLAAPSSVAGGSEVIVDWDVGRASRRAITVVDPGASEPVVLVPVDLEGDATTDLVLLTDRSPGVVVIPGRGNGRFEESRRSFLLMDHPVGARACDLDGDGDLDLATANRRDGAPTGTAFGVFLGDEPPRTTPRLSPPGVGPVSVSAGDVDGDGDCDILAAAGAVSAFLGSGQGSFEAAPTVLHDQPELPIHQAHAADLDGDGPLDIAGTSPERGELVVLWGRGDGTFERPRVYPGLGPETWLLAPPADLDGNGLLDLLLSRPGLREGDPRVDAPCFQVRARELRLGPGSIVSNLGPLRLIDLERDGDVDACGAELAAGAATFFVNSGDGGFCHAGRLSGLPRSRVVEVAHLDAAGADFPHLLVVTDEEQPLLGLVPLRVGIDTDGDGRRDGCAGARFLRGDANDDARVDVSDCITVLHYLLEGGAAPHCLDAADADDNERVQVTDVIVLLYFLFAGGSGPLAPRPEAGECGLDPVVPGRAESLGCGEQSSCH